MAAYFGNGYLLNILQRGASPIGKSRAQPGHAPFNLERTVETIGHQSPEVSGEQTLEVQTESADRPVEASTIPAVTKADPQIESPDVEAPETIQVTTRLDSRVPENVLPGTNASLAPRASDARTEESIETFRSRVPPESSEPSLPASVSSSTAPAGHAEPIESFSEVENPPEIKSSSKVLEVRMPADFFGHAKGEAANTSRAEMEPQGAVVPAVVDSQAESQLTVSKFSVSETTTVITSRRPNESSERKTIQLTQTGPIAESQIRSPLTGVLSEVVNQETQIESPAKRLPPETFEAAAPLPRIEQTSEYLQLRQPPIAPTPVAPAPRLRINRLDIQVINQVPAPPQPPPTQAPDVSQLLEKKHLGRVELLL